MGCFQCSNCDRLRESREHGYHSARAHGARIADYQFCEDCYVPVMERVHAGDLEFAEIDCLDMASHFLTEDLELVPIQPEPDLDDALEKAHEAAQEGEETFEQFVSRKESEPHTCRECDEPIPDPRAAECDDGRYTCEECLKGTG